ncbi:unnamed protein product [Linum tenue]|uniref:Ribosomal protein S14 n=1 Tax=Linum tenue TaxID=586396 RepID=A0AAV0H3J9_9ROSI|nr:unnamed protein product [Linum tenue]
MCCRQCFRSNAKEIGFIKVKRLNLSGCIFHGWFALLLMFCLL